MEHRPNPRRAAEALRFARTQLKIWNKKVADMNSAISTEADPEKREWTHMQLRMANAMTRHWHSQVEFAALYV